MLNKDKFMKSTVAMLAAMSLVSSVVFAAGTTNVSDKASLNVVDQEANGGQKVNIPNNSGAVLNVLGASSGTKADDSDGKSGNFAQNSHHKINVSTIDASTGASVLVTDNTTSVDNSKESQNKDNKYNVTDHKNTAKVVVTGGRTEMGLAAWASPTGTALGAFSNAHGKFAVAIGDNGYTNAVGGTVVGSASYVADKATNSTAVGFGSTVTDEGVNSVAIGANSVATKANEVSVGDAENGMYRTVTNVADGTLSADSHDAVTGRQLYKTNEKLKNVGALSAALAGLHPLDYNGTGSKFSLATAVGNYDGQQALALGGFYNISPDALVSIGASMSFGGDRQYAENLGFTFRVGEGASAPAGHHDEMADRFVAMEQAIAELKSQNEALAKKVASVEAENKDLKAKVDTLQK